MKKEEKKVEEKREDVEVREGMNPDICQHGWMQKLCGICTPVTKEEIKSAKSYVQSMS